MNLIVMNIQSAGMLSVPLQEFIDRFQSQIPLADEQCLSVKGWLVDAHTNPWMISIQMYNIYVYMGVSLNGGTPKTPQNDHF